MSTGQSSKKGPKRPQRSVARLDSIKNPQPRPAPKSQRTLATDCPNPDCGQTGTGIEEDGKSICSACGTVIQESTMVSDLTYALTAGGQHKVHGFHVGADQAFARGGDNVDPRRTMTSRQVSEANGKRYIAQICMALGIPQPLRDSADGIYKLAVNGFIQGRRIKSVAAVALYIACRTRREPNTFMLIDFADVLEVDVFNLGHVYKMLVDHIRLNGVGCVVQPINPEDLILRFCNRLEFGSETMRVARDAVRIVQRMNRDWMTPGRRPAGICGAALILAARMNNFRRTVREVVYVVKVQEQTIFNRLEEFKVTESSGLTVEQFRNIDLERFADPPIFTANKDGKTGKKKRGRKRKHLEFDDDGDNDQPTVISSRATSATPSFTAGQAQSSTNPQQQAQDDSRNMPPPPLPTDTNLVEDSARPSVESVESSNRAAGEPAGKTHNVNDASSFKPLSPNTSKSPSATASSEPPTKRKRGRPPKNSLGNAATPPASQLTDDLTLEPDITVALTNPLNIAHANALTSALESASHHPSPPATQHEPPNNRAPIPETEEISDSEFADDPEVSNCLLTPTEIAIKTRIWTHENREYLRIQSAKLLKQQLAEENGIARTIIRRKRKRGRMGDMTAYIGEDGEEGMPVAGTPAEAVMRMMGRRGFSKKLNYDIIKGYEESSTSASSSRRESVSIASQSPGGTFTIADRSVQPAERTQPPDETAETESAMDGEDRDEQQKALDTITEELEDEIEEEEDYDDDPYEGDYLSE